MNIKAETGPGRLDTAKLLLAVIVLAGGIGFYYYQADESMLLGVSGVLIALAVGVAVLMQTFQGQTLWRFIQGSRVEIRKVVWPTRQETMQTTLTVMVFALILAIFFWGLDFFLVWITRLLTGQGD